jgi:hypothetical protein
MMPKWGEGQQGANTAGRKRGFGGRMLALLVLDKMLARRKTQATLMRALDDEFKANPVGFFKTIVMPLLPREAKLTLDRNGVMEWKSLVGPGGPAAVAAEETQPDGQVIDVVGEEKGIAGEE